MANDFTNDPTCIALYRFETGALLTDTIGTSTLTASGTSPTSSNAQFKEGSWASLYVSASSEYLYRTDANLASNFPLKSGTTNTTISVAFWVYLVTLPTNGNFMTFGAKTESATPHITMWWHVFNNAGLTPPGVRLGKTDGTSSEFINHGTSITTATWYHITYGYRDSDKQWAIYLRDTNGATIGVDAAGTALNNIGLFSSTDFMLGVTGTGASPEPGTYLNGYLDEWVIFNRLLSPSDATNIAKGVYTCNLMGQAAL